MAPSPEARISRQRARQTVALSSTMLSLIVPHPPLMRELDVPGQTMFAVTRRPHASTVGVENRSTDRQSHAQPCALGGGERLEDPLEVDVLHAGTAVAHRDLDDARMMLDGLDAEEGPPGRAIRHGFRGVE